MFRTTPDYWYLFVTKSFISQGNEYTVDEQVDLENPPFCLLKCYLHAWNSFSTYALNHGHKKIIRIGQI
jgi:hypothetical protein